MIGCRQVGGGSLRGLGAQVMGFHCAKLQIVPWIIGLDRAASYSARVPGCASDWQLCEKAQLTACGTVLCSE